MIVVYHGRQSGYLISLACVGVGVLVVVDFVDFVIVEAMWNLSVDVISDARIRLDGAYTALEAFNASGAIEGDSVVLLSDVMPFSFVGFTVRNTKN